MFTMDHRNCPTGLAYFEVYVPVRGDVYGQRAADVVKAYLYGDFTVVDYGTAVGHDDTTAVVVRCEDFRGEVESRVQIQRDRLSSGLYASSEPVFFVRKEA